MAVRRNDLPQPLSLQVFELNLLAKVLVVAQQMLTERICHHLIHVYTNSLQRSPSHEPLLQSDRMMDAAMLSTGTVLRCGESRAGS